MMGRPDGTAEEVQWRSKLLGQDRGGEAKNAIRIVAHRQGAWSLRSSRSAVLQLQSLFDKQSSWATGRSSRGLRQMLGSSTVVVSAWDQKCLVGFGRATSDGQFRAVLWDVIVDERVQGKGVGRRIVGTLIEHPRLAQVERIYLMTSTSSGFYRQIGFEDCKIQDLMWINRKPN